MSKTVIIIQARMTSTRLPGKVLLPVLGKPLLEYEVERLKRVRLADEVVIATTTNEEDLPLVDFCQKQGIPFYRGSEQNVLSRYYEAAKQYHAGVIVRITSDCPLIDPGLVDQVIEHYKINQHQYDYVSNVLERTYPRGLDCEVFPFSSLERAYLSAQEASDFEHVTAFMYRNPELFRLGGIKADEDESGHRWTVDTEADFILIKKIIEELYPINSKFTFDDCLDLVRRNPQWALINAHVEQKHISDN